MRRGEEPTNPRSAGGAAERRPAGPRRCLVIHPGALGDLLLALPALAHLGALGFTRVLAAVPRLGALIQEGGGVEEAADLEALGLHRLFVAGSDPPMSAWLRTFDAVISWLGAGDDTYRRHLAAAGPPTVVGRIRPAPGAGLHASAHLLATLAPLGPLPATPPGVRLAPPAEALAWARDWLAERGLGPHEAVLLQVGAGSAAKVWPGALALCGRLQAARVPVVLTAGPADEPALAPFRAEIGFSERRVARALSLDRLAGLSSLARAFVGNDSGPTHLAAAVGCPTLALYGPTDPAVWRPLGTCVQVLAGRGPASAAPWGGVDVDRVLKALDAMLGGGAGAPASARSGAVVGPPAAAGLAGGPA